MFLKYISMPYLFLQLYEKIATRIGTYAIMNGDVYLFVSKPIKYNFREGLVGFS